MKSEKRIDIVEEIKSKASIYHYISQSVSLKQSGFNSYKGLCPFHKEKTSSFIVNSSSNTFYCFGCLEKGDVITFCQKINNIDFVSTLKFLAKDLNIEYDFQKIGNINKTFKEKYHLITNLLMNFYHQSLFSSQNTKHLEYLTKKRKLSVNTIRHFKLGFASGNIEDIKLQLEKHSITVEEASDMVKSIKLSKNNNYFDLFGNRIIIPIMDHNNSCIAFGGRSINDETEKYGKYINSPETELFKKQYMIFNHYNCVESIKEQRKVSNSKDYPSLNPIVVEGYMDTISLYQKGIKNVVAPLGTSISEDQISKIYSISSNPYFCLNSDSAGQKAMYKCSLKLLSQITEYHTPKLVNISGYNDFDDMISENKQMKSHDIYEFIVKNSKSFSDYIIDYSCLNFDFKDPQKVVIVEKEILKYLEKIKDPYLKKSYKNFFNIKIKDMQFLFIKNKNKNGFGKKFISDQNLDKNVIQDLNKEIRYDLYALFLIYIYPNILDLIMNDDGIEFERCIDFFINEFRSLYYEILTQYVELKSSKNDFNANNFRDFIKKITSKKDKSIFIDELNKLLENQKHSIISIFLPQNYNKISEYINTEKADNELLNFFKSSFLRIMDGKVFSNKIEIYLKEKKN